MLGLGKSCWSGVRPSRRHHQPGREREGERWRGWAVGGTQTPLGGRRSQSVSATLLGSSVGKTHTGNMTNRKLHIGNTKIHTGNMINRKPHTGNAINRKRLEMRCTVLLSKLNKAREIQAGTQSCSA